jgi:hypothetical protein
LQELSDYLLSRQSPIKVFWNTSSLTIRNKYQYLLFAGIIDLSNNHLYICFYRKEKIMLKTLLSSVLLTAFFALSMVYHILPIKSIPHGKEHKIILPDDLELQKGDLIFRRGRSIESQIVLLSDGNSDYSHVGIIYIKNKKPFVIHSVPAENGEEYELIKMESVGAFLSKDKATRFAVFRLEDTLMNITATASDFAYNCYLRKYCFDNQYDLLSDKKLYCTELIWKAYKNAGLDIVQNRLHDINLIFINKKMIMPSSLIESKFLKRVHSK